jgi:hypothetical protein
MEERLDKDRWTMSEGELVVWRKSGEGRHACLGHLAVQADSVVAKVAQQQCEALGAVARGAEDHERVALELFENVSGKAVLGSEKRSKTMEERKLEEERGWRIKK